MVYAKGNSQAFEYYQGISVAQKDKILALFRYMVNFGKIWDITKFRNEGDGIYTFKANQDRYLCFFFSHGKIIITNAFTKKTQKIPKKEKLKAIIAYNNYVEMQQKGAI